MNSGFSSERRQQVSDCIAPHMHSKLCWDSNSVLVTNHEKHMQKITSQYKKHCVFATKSSCLSKETFSIKIALLSHMRLTFLSTYAATPAFLCIFQV